MIKELIEALTILSSYCDENEYLTNCTHDELHICIDYDIVSEEDIKRLKKLGFYESECNQFHSFKHGSC